MDAKAPCCALGLIRERQQRLGLVALRLGKAITGDITAAGVNFGSGVLVNKTFEVVQFSFQFYGFGVYNVLVNPNNPVARRVLKTMIDTREYFFLLLTPGHQVTAFRSGIGPDNMTGLKAQRDRLEGSTTSDIQYQQALRQFHKYPDPPGTMLAWVCQDKETYLNLTTDQLELTSTGSPP